jgi:hypothetical protein
MDMKTGNLDKKTGRHVLDRKTRRHVFMSKKSCLHVFMSKFHVYMSKNEESRGLLLAERHGFLIVYCLTPCGVSGDD